MTDRTTLAIGSLLDDSYKRDAVHFAVIPVIASEELSPGASVEFVEEHSMEVKRVTRKFKYNKDMPVRGLGLGIIDPFLPESVQKGERCWLFLYPASITTLRHEWTHPDVPDFDVEIANKVADEILLRPNWRYIDELAKTLEVRTDQLMEHAKDYLENASYWSEGPRFEGVSLPDEFWDHYEKVTHKEVPEDARGSFFSCSC